MLARAPGTRASVVLDQAGSCDHALVLLEPLARQILLLPGGVTCQHSLNVAWPIATR